MILCLDIGNSQIYCGIVNAEGKVCLRFRYPSKQDISSDQFGVFLKSVLRENAIDVDSIQHIAICSVVPQLDYSLRNACKKYFDINPFFLNSHDHKIFNLDVQYRNPKEVGADRIANALAALHHYPNQALIVIDFGTATTFCAITAQRIYVGGAILPGISTSMEALYNQAAKLSAVEIITPRYATGTSTTEGIQSGLYYGQVGAIKELTAKLSQENFANEHPLVLATGGFSHLFAQERLFDEISIDLVFDGLVVALCQHQSLSCSLPQRQQFKRRLTSAPQPDQTTLSSLKT